MKKIILGFILGGILFGTIGVLASTTISSNNVTYQNKTVSSTLDELYSSVITGKKVIAAAITSKGVSTTSNDTFETMANNINHIETNNISYLGKFKIIGTKGNADGSYSAGYFDLSSMITDDTAYTADNFIWMVSQESWSSSYPMKAIRNTPTYDVTTKRLIFSSFNANIIYYDIYLKK